MDANVWGPHSWFFLHSITLGYPIHPTESQKKSYYDFINGLQHTLPCKQCRNHFRQKLSEMPLYPYLDTRKNFVRWMIEVHNRINISLEKKTYTVYDILNKYKEWYINKNYMGNSKLLNIIALIFIIQNIILIYLLFTKRISISLK
jgi:hypothetical protein